MEVKMGVTKLDNGEYADVIWEREDLEHVIEVSYKNEYGYNVSLLQIDYDSFRLLAKAMEEMNKVLEERYEDTKSL